MSFKVKELMISLSGGDTCSGVTKPTGCVDASEFGLLDVSSSRNLSVLKGQLRKAMKQA